MNGPGGEIPVEQCPGDGGAHDLMRLRLAPGVGPILMQRLLGRFGDAGRVLTQPPDALEQVQGIGSARARALVEAFRTSESAADREFELIRAAGARVVFKGQAGYPGLLGEIPSAPPALVIRGSLEPDAGDAYPVGIVGSRRCTSYGVEQATRFAGALGEAGLTVVSGGARGIDTAAHKGALNRGGRTVVVLGCGVDVAYPPENETLFERIVEEGRGAVVSELPMGSPPVSENFPARNRIISGLSLGVLVIEAGAKSGALITAREAVESQGREVMALPGRVDSDASRGSLELLRSGGASIVVEPADVLHALESPAHHRFRGTHEARYPALDAQMGEEPATTGGVHLEGELGVIFGALGEPTSLDALAERTGLGAGAVRAGLTRLEIQGLVVRAGSLVQRRS